MSLRANSLLGRMVSISILLLVVLAIGRLVAAPMMSHLQGKAATIDQLQTRYQKLSRLIARGYPEDAAPSVSGPQFLASGSRASAQTALQSEVRRIALMHKVNLRSITAAEQTDDNTETVSIIVTAESNLKSLVRLLYQLETSTEALWARDLVLRAENRGGTVTDGTRLQLRFVAEAMWASDAERGSQ